MRYAFIEIESVVYAVRTLCRMMRVHPSGYYAWLQHRESERTRHDRVLIGHIKHKLAGVGQRLRLPQGAP